MNLLKELVEKINAVEVPNDDLVAGYELQPGDRVVGILPVELQRFGVVYEDAINDLNLLHEQLEAERNALDPPEKAITAKQAKEFRQRHAIAHSRFEVIKRAFWSAIRRTFPEIVDEKSIGLRKGWQLVVFNPVNRCDDCEQRDECFLSRRTLGDGMEMLFFGRF